MQGSYQGHGHVIITRDEVCKGTACSAYNNLLNHRTVVGVAIHTDEVEQFEPLPYLRDEARTIRRLFVAELGPAQSRLDELLSMVQFYRALGGGWQVGSEHALAETAAL
jgi:hypothetical protein